MLSNDPRHRLGRPSPAKKKTTVQFHVPGREPFVARLELPPNPPIGLTLSFAGAQWQIVSHDPVATVAELCFPTENGELTVPSFETAL